jgi:hypothetical protein
MLLIIACGGAMAAQNLNSASGYVLTPDASIAPMGQWQFSGAYVVPRGTSELSKIQGLFPCDGTGFNLRALYGIGEKTEAGIGIQNIDKDAGDASSLTVAAKMSLLDRAEGGTGLAAGISYRSWGADMSIEAGGFTLDADMPNVLSLYVVLDREWKVQENTWSAGVGLAYDTYTSTSQEGTPLMEAWGPVDENGNIDSKGFLRPFIGASLTTGEWTFLFDYKTDAKSGGFKYQDTFWSIAARRAVSDGLTATAGFTTSNIPYTDSDPGFFIDLTWVK